METQQQQAITQRRLIKRLLLAVLGMFGFAYALVPLYDVFCQITGIGGRTSNQAAEASPLTVDYSRVVTVEFIALTNQDAPWIFQPQVERMQVHPGQLYQTAFIAHNQTAQPLLGQAIASVAPGLAARYLQKTECFCFQRQAFAGHEQRSMPLIFRLDPQLPAETNTLTLSYTFFRLNEQGG